ncbi:MAG: Phosphoribosyl 1,2-cyclic phosphate phosphodiesterase [Chlamydiales bacterium]|nr:Phosphoribosyl 1,2-cyclic phosphate phosphodiesterase [Chlamydiales bacterium]
MKAEFLFLGTGGSSGIPMIGCDCPVCISKDPKNARLRPSALLKIEDKHLLIDSGPDFRTQALRYHIHHLDGVLLTHSHFDHVAGLDELRIYYLIERRALPVLASKETLKDLKRRYDYLFREKSWGMSLAAQLEFHVLEKSRGQTDFLGIALTYVSYEQGGMAVNGYRFGPFAYISDIRTYPDTLFADLKGVEILVVSALRQESSMMHFTVDEAVEFAQKIGAKQVYFTHIGHELDHHQTNATLPEGISLAYDGLTVEFSHGDG